MNKNQFFIGLIFSSLLGGGVALAGFHWLVPNQSLQVVTEQSDHVRLSNYNFDTSESVVPAGLNFVYAAKEVTAGVVHIRSVVERPAMAQDPVEEHFRQFFGNPRRNNPQRPSVGTGSGVILSSDGYIVTNNHVVKNATDIEVLLNDNRTFKAKVIGTDPTTDLALLKIEADDLPFVAIGNSDKVNVGEWVLAVGNPFEFRSTVTAGIISAKGRNINILKDKNNLQIESFLQTDAAVNPGNSGGALVNLNGELVGINTAIATPTGTFAGYSFAVPSNLMHKVIGDLKEFGVVQRALLGINIRDVNSQLAEEEGLDVLEGVYVMAVNPESGASEVGIQEGDVIIAIDDEAVKKTSELQEKVALNRPGDKVKVTFLREGKKKTVTATLRNTLGTTESIAATSNSVIVHGATFEDISDEEKSKLKIEGGAKLKSLDGGVWKQAGIKEGFIVTSIDKRPILTVEDLSRSMSRASDGSGTLIQGIYENGQRAYYGIGW